MKRIYEDIINLLIASFIAAFCFTIFKIEKYFYYLIPCLIFFFLTYFIKNIIAEKLDYKLKSKFLFIRRISFSDQSKLPFPFPIGIFFALLFSLISYGGIQILCLLGYEYEGKIGRIRKKYRFKEQDLTTISIVSLISAYILILIFYAFNIKEFSLVITWLLISNSLPFGSLDGSRIFHANWTIWVFYFSLFLISLILINITQIIITLILSIIAASLIGIFLLYKYLK